MTTYSDVSVSALIACAALLSAGYCYVCWAAGRLLTLKTYASSSFILAFALGHVTVAVLLQLVVTFGFLTVQVVGPMLVAIALLGTWCARPWRQRFNFVGLLPQNLLCFVLVIGTGIMLLLLLVASFSPPGTDGAAYYMAQPKLMAALGFYKPLPAFESFAALPAIAEMPYAAMYLFGGDVIGMVASKFSMWPVLIAILLLLWQCARGLGMSKDTAWLLMAMLATSTAVTLVAWDGKTDLIGLMYLLAAVLYMPGLVSTGGSRANTLLFGVMAAAAVMSKFSYALILPFVLGVPLLLLWRHEPKKLAGIAALAAAGAILAFLLGWWTKNWMLFSDPFVPIARLRESTPKFSLDQVWFNAEYTSWIAWTFPLAATFGKYPMQHGGISPMWLMLLPALWMKPWQSDGGRKALYLALGSLAALAAWVLLRPSVIAPRYFLPALVLPCLLLALGYQQWCEKRKAYAYIALSAVLVLLFMHVKSTHKAARYSAGAFYLSIKGTSKTAPLLDLVKRLEADPRPQPKILLLSYVTEALPSRMLTSFMIYSNIKPNEKVLDFALREKVDYILYSPNTHKRTDIDLPPPPGLKVEKTIYIDGVYSLYVLRRDTNDF